MQVHETMNLPLSKQNNRYPWMWSFKEIKWNRKYHSANVETGLLMVMHRTHLHVRWDCWSQGLLLALLYLGRGRGSRITVTERVMDRTKERGSRLCSVFNRPSGFALFQSLALWYSFLYLSRPMPCTLSCCGRVRDGSNILWIQ